MTDDQIIDACGGAHVDRKGFTYKLALKVASRVREQEQRRLRDMCRNEAEVMRSRGERQSALGADMCTAILGAELEKSRMLRGAK